MGPDYLQREMDKLRRRAARLGVDDLICDIFFTGGLRHYASWSQDPDWICPSISEVRESYQLGSLGFTLKGRRYSLHAEEERSSVVHEPATIVIGVILRLDGNVVFGERVEHQITEGIDLYRPQSVTAFLEGDWIKDFRDLQQEMKRVAKRNLRRMKTEREQHAGRGWRRIWHTIVAAGR